MKKTIISSESHELLLGSYRFWWIEVSHRIRLRDALNFRASRHRGSGGSIGELTSSHPVRWGHLIADAARHFLRRRRHLSLLCEGCPFSLSPRHWLPRGRDHVSLAPSLAPARSWPCRWRRRAFRRRSRRWTKLTRRRPISSRLTSRIRPPTASPKPDTPTTKSEWRPTCPYSRWKNPRCGVVIQILSGFERSWSGIPRSSFLPFRARHSNGNSRFDRTTVFSRKISSRSDARDWKDSSTKWPAIPWHRTKGVSICSCRSPSSTRTTFRERSEILEITTVWGRGGRGAKMGDYVTRNCTYSVTASFIGYRFWGIRPCLCRKDQRSLNE